MKKLEKILAGISNFDLVTFTKADDENIEHLKQEARENPELEGIVKALKEFESDGDDPSRPRFRLEPKDSTSLVHFIQ
jgi:hypothetical protein